MARLRSVPLPANHRPILAAPDLNNPAPLRSSDFVVTAPVTGVPLRAPTMESSRKTINP